jgi:K+-transporting ATPase ATPase C chain
MSMTNTTTQLQDHVGLRAPLLFAAVILLGFGLSYSLAGAALGRVLFPASATGSTIERDGKVIGSALVAQPFADARYFQPRPSAANYDPMAAAGSNLARSNPDLHKRIDDAITIVAAREGIAPSAVPMELVTHPAAGSIRTSRRPVRACRWRGWRRRVASMPASSSRPWMPPPKHRSSACWASHASTCCC